MRSFYIFTATFLSIFSSFAQRNDNTWLFGYGGPPTGDRFGISVLKFDDGNVTVSENPLAKYEFYLNTSMFSDSSGKLFAYFNGFDMQNAASQLIENGKGFDVEIVHHYQYYSDDAVVQGSLFLEWPEHPDSVLFLYIGQAYIDGIGYVSRNFSYAVLDKKANAGLGKVVAREQNILEDTIGYAHLTAVKHANGRDWWILIRETDSNRFYHFLISPSGIKQVSHQIIPFSIINGAGQSVFSPNGTHFATFNGISETDGSWLDVFDFDRCSGYLSNQRQLFFKVGKPGGVAFSPNSRYLYMTIRDTLLQFDMDAPNFKASRKTIAIREPSPVGVIPPTYFSAQIALDQKIYVSATNGIQYLHVIEHPDEAGTVCSFREKGLKLPTINASSMPNFPNYRLGPLDGSPCDTLGLDNHPVAWYRYAPDTLDYLKIDFHDLSYYEPNSWSWDFGDNQTSAERAPTHLYATKGTYQVCLTVSNVNSSSTHCKTLQLSTSAADSPVLQNGIDVLPNPFGERLSVLCNTQLPGAAFQLYDLTGRLVRQERLVLGINEIETADLPPGAYFWEVTAGRERIKTGKLVKVQ